MGTKHKGTKTQSAFLRIGLFALISYGCSSAEDPWVQNIYGSRSLVFLGLQYAADGGSIRFNFKTDQGKAFGLFALHQNTNFGGNSRYQEIRVCGSPAGDFELGRTSSLQVHLLKLLETCQIGVPAENQINLEKPTLERLSWLVSRVRDRSLKWSSFR